MTTATYALRDVRPAPARVLNVRGRSIARPRTRSRQRLGALVVLLLVVMLVMVTFDRGGAQAGLQDEVAGHVVVEPGQTLWDVAATSAPEGVDTRQQLADLQRLNGLTDAHVDAWTVVLLPAR